MSYTELRHFLTSAAVYISSTQQVTKSGAIVPSDIVPTEKGGKQPLGAGDNWDHNERTIDGRRTTHAMTSILMSPSTDQALTLPGIPRVETRTLNLQCVPGGGLSKVIPYRKPVEGPEPCLTPSPVCGEMENKTT